MVDELVEWFIVEVERFDLWSDKVVRDSLSKHQRVIRELLDLVEELKLRYYEEIETST